MQVKGQRPVLTLDTDSLPRRPPAARLHGVNTMEVNDFDAISETQGSCIHSEPTDKFLPKSKDKPIQIFVMINESVIDIVLLRAELASYHKDDTQLIACFDQALKIAFAFRSFDTLRSEILVVKIMFFGAQSLYTLGFFDDALQALEAAEDISKNIPKDKNLIQVDELAKWTRLIQNERINRAKGGPGDDRHQSSSPRVDTPTDTPSDSFSQHFRNDSGASSQSRPNLDSLMAEFAGVTTPMSAIDHSPWPTEPSLLRRLPSSRNGDLSSLGINPGSRPSYQRSITSFPATKTARSSYNSGQSPRVANGAPKRSRSTTTKL